MIGPNWSTSAWGRGRAKTDSRVVEWDPQSLSIVASPAFQRSSHRDTIPVHARREQSRDHLPANRRGTCTLTTGTLRARRSSWDNG